MLKKLVFTLAAAAMMPAVAQAQTCSSNGAFQAAIFEWGIGIDYVDCFGPRSGNDNGSETDAVNAAWEGDYGTFTLMGSSDDAGNGPFTSTDGSPLVFDSPISGYFALTLKQANFHSIYLLYAQDPVSSVNWNTLGVANNGGADEPGKLSHAVLYAGPAGMSTVPEPSTYVLMGSGLVALLGAARFRRRA